MTDRFPPEMNPDWRRWYEQQPQETKDALAKAWSEAALAPGISAQHPNAGYARRAALLARSVSLGYER